MEELEKLKRAKMYIEKLANGINPITDAELPADTVLNNVRLSRCFFYVSGILQECISNGGVTKRTARSGQRFFITEEQAKAITILDTEVYMKDLTERINAAAENNQCRRFQQKWLSGWLVNNGFMQEYLDERNRKQKRATAGGESIGLRTEMRSSFYGDYPITLLSENAQRFIIENIKSILSESERHDYPKELEYQGRPWSKYDEEILVQLYNNQVLVSEIADALGRTEQGIRARLTKLGIIDFRSDAQ